MTKPVAVLGGGRWAGIVVGVLRTQVLPPIIPILWLSAHHGNTNPAKAAELGGVTLVGALEDIWQAQPEALIVASATPQHALLTKAALERGIPVLCEKPIALTVNEAEQLLALAQQQGLPLGVNLEFSYASYLAAFQQATAALPRRKIEVVWQDPAAEVREGTSKRADTATPLAHDQLPHVWSLLRPLLAAGDVALLASAQADATAGGYRLTGTSAQGVGLAISISRTAPQRVRRVVVDEVAVLDFNPEPGTISLRGAVTPQNWTGLRPLGASLHRFWQVVQGQSPVADWPTSLAQTLGAVQFAAQGDALLI